MNILGRLQQPAAPAAPVAAAVPTTPAPGVASAIGGLRQVEADTRIRNMERRIAGIPSSEELAALPKKELIRIANNVLVATYGTKNDIIARIESRRT